MFGLDDGTGDISGLRADVGAHVLGERAALLLAGRTPGCSGNWTRWFPRCWRWLGASSEVRGKAWRVAELDDPTDLVAGFEATEPAGATYRRCGGAGRLDSAGRRTGRPRAGVPLGVLSARQAEFVAAIEAPVVITPWRSLLVCDLAEGGRHVVAGARADGPGVRRELALAGRDGLRRQPRLREVAGRCARQATRAVSADTADGRVHYVGCERACGSPVSGTVLVATEDGFRVRGE